MDSFNKTLNRGSRGEDVKALQEYLNSIGYADVKADGIYGPITEQAVKGFQSSNGLSPDGSFGPNSIEYLSSQVQQELTKAPDDPSYMYNTETGQLNPNFQPRNEQEDDLFYNTAVLQNDMFKGNSPEAMEAAALSGDFSSLYDEYGKPFSNDVYNQAVSDSAKALNPRFEVDKEFTTQGLEDQLRQNQESYDDTITDQRDQFEANKDSLDKTAADRGVLFSGARDQKERKLEDIYNTSQERLQRSNNDAINSLTRNYQYQYGDKAVNQNRLSQYYNSGGNTFNAKKATGGAQRSKLSEMYRPSNTGFAGSAVTAQNANVQSRAGGLLKNRANKLFSTGYNNKL